MLGVALALLASVMFGVGDFIGGSKSRLMPVLTVLLISQVAGFVWIGSVMLIAHPPAPGTHELAMGALSAVAGTAGLACFFRAIAIGKMSVVVPIAATAAVIPVGYGIANGERPSTLQLTGMALALAGVVFASREPGSAGDGGARVATGVGLAFLSALFIGTFFVALGEASEGGAVWASFANRVTSISLLAIAALALRPAMTNLRPHLPALALVGTFDVSANLAFAAATREGLLSLVAVAGSLYPVVTVLLARLLLHERVHRLQEGGVLVALAGVVLIAGG
jgi:drug/metabolite transporter (DMT)-like permease